MIAMTLVEGMGQYKLTKIISYLIIAGLFLAFIIFIHDQYQHRLLREGLNKVERVKIIYYRGNYQPGKGNITVLSSDKDRDLILELYNKIVSTKLVTYIIPDEDESQEGDPVFELIFTYKDSKSDRIESTETGKYIFRRLFASGWIGGPRDDILSSVESLAAF